MSTATLQRPPQVDAGGSGGAPARRAVVRWAWRLFRREWRQQLIVLTLIVIAVTATILGAAIATNTPPPANAGFGSADHLLSLPGTDPHLAADIEKVRRAFGTVEVIENRTIATGLVHGALLRAQDPRGAYGRSMLALRSGHYPKGANEVALTDQLASTLNLHVGGRWHEAGRAVRVVGLVENPQNLLDNFALVAPGQLGSPSRVTVLFDASASSAAAFTAVAGARPVTPHASSGFAPDLVVLAIAVVGLIFVGLVAVAGFTVLAQRRLRGLGMLSSLGASDRHVRLVMVANGAFVGIVGAVLGAVLGLAAWIGYAPHLSISAHHRISWTSLPWWLVATAMVLAAATATLASRHPARAVARTPVVAALSGRPPPPRRVHRSAVPGIVLLAVGPVLLAFCGGWGGGNNGGQSALFLLGGLLACAIGLLLVAPLGVALLGVNAARAPVAIRIALRDLSRYRARSGAALAATSLAVLIAMLTALVATGRFADPVDYFGPNLAANQLVLYPPGSSANGVGPGRSTPGAQQQRTPPGSTQATTIAASLGTADVLALRSAGAILLQGNRGGPGTVYVATPELLAHYGIDPDAIDPTTTLLTSRPGLQGTADLRLLYGDMSNPKAHLRVLQHPKIQTLGRLPTETAAPNLIVTARAVAALHLQIGTGGWLMQATGPLSAAQVNSARQTAAAAGMTIDAKNDAPSLSELRNYATAAGIMLALGVLAMTVGLIRSEAAGDLRTLTATGAAGHTRRTITAATAGTLGLLAGLFGTAVAYLATVAFFRSQLSERMSHVPTLDLLLVLLGLPLAATAGGWLFAGRQPAAIAHQPLE